MGRVGGVFLLLVTGILLFGCGPRNYSLPKSWPIPQLTLPAGSTIPSRPIVMHELAASWTDKDWGIHFDCPSANYQAVIDHVESCLKPINYSEFWIHNPRIGSTRQWSRTYYSPDGMTCVTVNEGTRTAGVPTGTPYDSDFILSIKVTVRPDKKLKRAGTTSDSGVQTFLEAIQ